MHAYATTNIQSIDGYEIKGVFQQDPRSTLYRGTRTEDGVPVLLRVPTAEYPSPQDAARLRHEYQLVRDLDYPGIVKALNLIKARGRPVLVMEDAGYVPLSIVMEPEGSAPEPFLNLAIGLTRTLELIHARGVIHKDIHPGNILVDRQRGLVKLANFGLASQLSRENQPATAPALMEGTLAYMSPEQTGRMNRALDYRTDFYSLGLTLYELLVGRRPFSATEPLELVHCHIARQPTPPHEMRPGIPVALSTLVQKLLAKAAEDRYQSAYGLRMDLEECLAQWRRAGGIELRTLGTQDGSDTLRMPQRLYGRDTEQAALLSSFDRASLGAKELVLVYGYSGVGKSTLIHEIHKPIVRQRGYFISGKFDQFKQGLPYSSFIQAFQQLIRQLLTEGEELLADWRTRLREALGTLGQVVLDVLPEVELIIGPQPPVAPLAPGENQNRFRQVFQSFIRVFAQREHPLVMFLDDLQWADSASLELIQYLLADQDLGHMLLIGAYRDNEVSDSHPLIRVLEGIRKGPTRITSLALAPLSQQELDRWLADTLRCDVERAAPLANLLYGKTNGNPFFVIEFLSALYQDGLLRFDREARDEDGSGRGGWRWEVQQIQSAQITDNVVDLLMGRLQKLPPETREVLKLAACIGNRFDSSLLSIAYQRSGTETARALWMAVREGFILPLDPAYKLLQDAPPDESSEPVLQEVAVPYAFLHDRVQQAAYSLIPAEHRKKVHLAIGRLMRRNLAEARLAEQLFELVNHLNAGAELITDASERREVAELNLTAGRKAKAATAYEPALVYLSAGTTLLGEEGWENDHTLTFTLHLERAESEYLTTRFAAADSRFERLLGKARTDRDRVAVHTSRVVQYLHLRQYAQAVDTGVLALKLLGIPLSAHPRTKDVLWQLAQVKWRLRGQKIPELLSRPDQASPEIRAAMDLLISLWFPAYLLNRESLAGLLVLKMVHLSLVYGNTETSSFAYACYGMLNSSLFKDPKTGAEYGQLALALARKFNAPAVSCRTFFMIASFLDAFSSHLRKTVGLLEESLQCSLASGNLPQAGFSICLMSYWLCILDTPISEVAREAQRFLEFARRADAQKVVQAMLNVQRWVRELQQIPAATLASREYSLEPGDWVTEDMERGQHYLLQLHVALLFGRYEELVELGHKADRYRELLDPSSVFVAHHAFYWALGATAALTTARGPERKRYLEVLETTRRRLAHWTEHSPQNVRQKYLLVRAEIARLEGKAIEAAELYDEAIQAARENEYMQDVAIACERAAWFHLEHGRNSLAGSYLQEARFGYLTWGATSKVQALEAQYPQFLGQAASPASTRGGTEAAHPPTSLDLDLRTAIQASQVLSGEIVLDQLLTRIMEFTLQNAGAGRGFLIMKDGAQWVVEAEGALGQQAARVMQSLPVEQCQELSPAIVSFVARTCESVVLRDAAREGLFTNDANILLRRPKSVLCTPLIHQKQLVGILYLENNLTSDAFTPDRLELLQLLSSQAAISIVNARLYERLEQKVEERTEELSAKNSELKVALETVKQTQRMLIQSEKMSSLGHLTAGIAHEIKNPLNFVKNFAVLSSELVEELLVELNANPDLRIAEALRKLTDLLEDLKVNTTGIIQHGNRANEIINGMLMHSRSATGDRMSTDLNALVDQNVMLAYRGLRASNRGPEVLVEKDFDPSHPEVELVAQGIARVVLNLVNNALHAASTRPRQQTGGEATPRVRVSTRSSKGHVEIRVWDNGGGVPSAFRERIFEPFFTTKPPGQGTGLGLSISHDIVVQGHGGTLRLESEEGRYAEFIVELPRGAKAAV